MERFAGMTREVIAVVVSATERKHQQRAFKAARNYLRQFNPQSLHNHIKIKTPDARISLHAGYPSDTFKRWVESKLLGSLGKEGFIALAVLGQYRGQEVQGAVVLDPRIPNHWLSFLDVRGVFSKKTKVPVRQLNGAVNDLVRWLKPILKGA